MKWVKRIIGGAVLLGVLVLVLVAGGGYVPPDPDECRALTGPQAAYAAETMGCPDVDFRNAQP